MHKLFAVVVAAVLIISASSALAQQATFAEQVVNRFLATKGQVSERDLLLLMSQPKEFLRYQQVLKATAPGLEQEALAIRRVVFQRALARLSAGEGGGIVQAVIALGSWATELNAGDMDIIVKGGREAAKRFNQLLHEEIGAILSQKGDDVCQEFFSRGARFTLETFEIYVSTLEDFGYDSLKRAFHEALEIAAKNGQAAGAAHLKNAADAIIQRNLSAQRFAAVQKEYYPGATGQDFVRDYFNKQGKSRTWRVGDNGALDSSWEAGMTADQLGEAMIKDLGLSVESMSGAFKFPVIADELVQWVERSKLGAREQAKGLVRAYEAKPGGFLGLLTEEEARVLATARILAKIPRENQAYIREALSSLKFASEQAFSEAGQTMLWELTKASNNEAMHIIVENQKAAVEAAKAGREVEAQYRRIKDYLMSNEQLAGYSKLKPEHLIKLSEELPANMAFRDEMVALLEFMAEGSEKGKKSAADMLKRLVKLAFQQKRLSAEATEEAIKTIRAGKEISAEVGEVIAVLRKDLADLASIRAVSPAGDSLAECARTSSLFSKGGLTVTPEIEAMVAEIGKLSDIQLLQLGFKNSEIALLRELNAARAQGARLSAIGEKVKKAAPKNYQAILKGYILEAKKAAPTALAFQGAFALWGVYSVVTDPSIPEEEQRKRLGEAIYTAFPTAGLVLDGLPMAYIAYTEGGEVDSAGLAQGVAFAGLEVLGLVNPAAGAILLATYATISVTVGMIQAENDRQFMTALYNALDGNTLKVQDGTRSFDISGLSVSSDQTTKLPAVIHSAAFNDLYTKKGGVLLDTGEGRKPYNRKVNEAIRDFAKRYVWANNADLKLWETAVKKNFPDINLDEVETWNLGELTEQAATVPGTQFKVGARLVRRYLNQRDLLTESALRHVRGRLFEMQTATKTVESSKKELEEMERVLTMEKKIIPNAQAENDSLMGWFWDASTSNETRLEQVAGIWKRYVKTYKEATTVFGRVTKIFESANLTPPTGSDLFGLTGVEAKDKPKIDAVDQSYQTTFGKAFQEYRGAKGSPPDQNDPFDADAWKRLLSLRMRVFLAEFQKTTQARIAALEKDIQDVLEEVKEHYRDVVDLIVTGPTEVETEKDVSLKVVPTRKGKPAEDALKNTRFEWVVNNSVENRGMTWGFSPLKEDTMSITVNAVRDVKGKPVILATTTHQLMVKKKPEDKKPEDKKPEDKKPEDKKIGLVPPVIQTCSYQYSEWGECSRETKKQTRTVTGREPQGCVEKVKPILEQACTPPTAAIKITVLAEVMETDIFKASAQVSPDIAGRASKYLWGGGAELINPDEKGTRSTKTPQATLQFQPMTGKRGEPFDPNRKIYLDVYDGAGKLMGKGEIPIKLKPVGFSASAAWEVTPVADGFNLKRKEAIKKAPCGDQSCEAVVRGTLQLRWTGGSLGSNSSVPKNMEDLKKEVPRLHVGKMQGTYHAVTPGKDEEFAIGDFKGLVAHKPPQLYYQGSEYVDLVFPGTLSWVTGYLLKGNSRIFINGDVSGGGSRKGEGGRYWFDDTPFVDQHTKAAHAEMMAILKSIVIGPDNKIKQIPYKGPAFDGSDLPSVKLVYSQKGKLKMGEVVIVKAVVEKAKPEDSPLKFEWSGDHEGQGETVNFMAQKAGKSTLSVTVTGARFPMGSASANFEVEDLKAVIIKDAPTANSFAVGTKARFSVTLTSGGQKASGNYFYRWQPNIEVTFEPPEGAASQTTGVFRRIGRTRVWVEVLEKKGASLSTVARSENLELDIINPKLSLSAVPDTPLVGQEVKITVQEDPKIEEKTIDFWWEIAGNAANPGPLQNNRFYTYKPKDIKPVTVTVHAKGRDKGDDFGSQKITVTAKAYTVSVSSPKYLGMKPRIWKCDTEFGRECPGLVEVGDTQFAVHHDLFMKASINPSVDSSKLRYGWTISPDGCSGGESISDEIRLNCSNAGTYAVKVEVTNTDGAKLGEAAQSLTVSISQETLNNSKKTKEAYDKLQKAKELVAQGKLDEGISLANESASLDPKNAEAKSLSQKWRTEKQTVTQQLEKAKKLITENQIDQAEKELAVAQKLHPKYAPVVDMERLLRDKSKEVNEKTGKAKQLRAEGEALQRQGKLKEAVVKYKESLNYLPDKGLEEHIRKLEAQIAQDAQKKDTAERLWQEGTGLYGQKKLSEALAKFKESLALWQDPTKAEYVRKMEAERTAAQKLRDEGAALQQQGMLADAVKKYKESLTHWPNPDLERHISVVEDALKRKQDADLKKGTADKLWQEGTGFFNQGRPSDALTKFKESLGYWSDATRTKYVSDLEARRVKAVALRDEGAKLQQQNRIQEAIAQYKDSQTFWPDPGLTSHIATLEGKLKQDIDTAARKARAKQLRDEGYALQQRSQIREAIAKYTESLTYWPDADLENHIRQLKTKLAQDPVKPPLSTTTSRFGAILGHTLNVREVANVIYNGTWTRRDGTDLFDAVWDPHARDVIEIESVNGNQIVLYRHGNKGRYSGTLSADGSRIISGTASWYAAGWSWSATVSGRSTEGQRDPSPPPAVPSKKPGSSLDPFVGKWNMTSPDGTKVVLKTWIKDGRIMGAAEANGQNLLLDLYPIGERQLKGTIKISFALTSGGKKISEMTTNGSVLADLSPDGGKMPLKIISEKGESNTIMLERLSGTVETGPSLAGAWTCNGRPTSITQDASGNLVFTNEMGWVSKGRFAGAGTVIATNWENGLAGSLQDNNNTIRWANGTTWYRKR